MSLKKLFPKPKEPAIPSTPQEPSMAGQGTESAPQLNYSSLISTSAGGLKRKATTAKRTILGGA
jgi:hypothetical protein